MSGPAVRLGPQHADLLVDLESAYPEPMRQGPERIRRKLHLLASTDKALSWILESEGDFGAYVVAWVSTSRLDVPQPDRVILIDDLQVNPAHGTALYQILQVLARDIQERGFGELCLEGVCRRNAYRLFMDHLPVIRRLGYDLVGTSEYWDDAFGEEMCWMRWSPLHRIAGTAVATVDATELSEEAFEEAIEPRTEKPSMFFLL